MPDRIPVWKQTRPQPLRNWRLPLHRFYHSHLPLLCFICIVAWWIILRFVSIHPPVGTYITLSAFLVFIVTIWPPENVWSKALWVFVLLGFTVLEINNSYQERGKYDAEQADARTKAAKAFESIADGIKTSNEMAQQSFAATMDRMRSLASLSSENIKIVIGGDSFCYLVFMDDGVPVIIHRGKYPLYGVEARITDMRTHQQTDRREDVVLKPGDMSVGKAWVGFGTPIRFSSQEAQDFNIFFTAKNGSWTELLRMRRVNKAWERAIKVNISITPIISGNQPLTWSHEEVSKGFPKEDLIKDTDWTNPKQIKRGGPRRSP